MTAATVRFAVRLTPRAGTDRVGDVVDGVLHVRVAAPPVDEAANRSLVRLLAEALDLPPSAIRVVAGARGRRKSMALDGLAAELVLARWPGLRL